MVIAEQAVVLIVEVEDNQIIKIRGDKEAPVNNGQTCVKGAFAYKYVHAPKRLKFPLIRKAGEACRGNLGRSLTIYFIQIKHQLKLNLDLRQFHCLHVLERQMSPIMLRKNL